MLEGNCSYCVIGNGIFAFLSRVGTFDNQLMNGLGVVHFSTSWRVLISTIQRYPGGVVRLAPHIG